METPKNPDEMKKWWDTYSAGEIAMFLTVTFIFLAAVNAAGIWIAQKIS